MTCQKLFASPALEIASCVGDASRRQPAPMHFTSFEAHFQDDGAYVLHQGHRSILIDVHYVELRRAGSTLTYSRPAVSADRGTSIRFGSSVLDALLPAADDDRTDFPTGAVHLGPGEFRRLRALRRAIEAPLRDAEDDVEPRAIALLARVVRAAYRDRVAIRARRPATSVRRQMAVERAKEFLTEHSHDQPTLAEAAEAVEYAPHHFARIFSDHTGLSVHQYLNELRLRQAAVRLDDGADNLTSLALDLGFSSQSHFTTAFRARFGCTPGVYRIRPTDSGAPAG